MRAKICLKVTCPHCKAEFEADELYVRSEGAYVYLEDVRCPKCHKYMVVGEQTVQGNYRIN